MSDERVDINIEQLVLELPFRDTEQGQALTDEIVRRLRQMPPLPAPGSSVRLPDLRVDLPPASAPATNSEIAEAVVAGIHRALSQAIEAASPGPAAQEPPAPPAGAPASVTQPTESAGSAPTAPAATGPGQASPRFLALVDPPDLKEARLSAVKARDLGRSAGNAAWEAARRAGRPAAPDASAVDPLGLDNPMPEVSKTSDTELHAPKPGPAGYVSVVGTFQDLKDLHDSLTSAYHAKTVINVALEYGLRDLGRGKVAVGVQLVRETLQTTYFKGTDRNTPHEKDRTLGHHEDRHKALARAFFTTANVNAIVKREKIALVVDEDQGIPQADAIHDYLFNLERHQGEVALDPPDSVVTSQPKFSGVTK